MLLAAPSTCEHAHASDTLCNIFNLVAILNPGACSLYDPRNENARQISPAVGPWVQDADGASPTPSLDNWTRSVFSGRSCSEGFRPSGRRCGQATADLATDIMAPARAPELSISAAAWPVRQKVMPYYEQRRKPLHIQHFRLPRTNPGVDGVYNSSGVLCDSGVNLTGILSMNVSFVAIVPAAAANATSLHQ